MQISDLVSGLHLPAHALLHRSTFSVVGCECGRAICSLLKEVIAAHWLIGSRSCARRCFGDAPSAGSWPPVQTSHLVRRPPSKAAEPSNHAHALSNMISRTLKPCQHPRRHRRRHFDAVACGPTSVQTSGTDLAQLSATNSIDHALLLSGGHPKPPGMQHHYDVASCTCFGPSNLVEFLACKASLRSYQRAGSFPMQGFKTRSIMFTCCSRPRSCTRETERVSNAQTSSAMLHSRPRLTYHLHYCLVIFPSASTSTSGLRTRYMARSDMHCMLYKPAALDALDALQPLHMCA